MYARDVRMKRITTICVAVSVQEMFFAFVCVPYTGSENRNSHSFQNEIYLYAERVRAALYGSRCTAHASPARFSFFLSFSIRFRALFSVQFRIWNT